MATCPGATTTESPKGERFGAITPTTSTTTICAVASPA
jgi:hypothetical protein